MQINTSYSLLYRKRYFIRWTRLLGQVRRPNTLRVNDGSTFYSLDMHDYDGCFQAFILELNEKSVLPITDGINERMAT